MKVVISSANKSIEMEYMAYTCLRMTIATYCPDEIKKHYMALVQRPLKNEKEIESYDATTMKIYEKYPNRQLVMKFLYFPDFKNATFSPETAAQLLTVLEKHNGLALYKMNRSNKGLFVNFKVFKDILKDSVKTKSSFSVSVCE